MNFKYVVQTVAALCLAGSLHAADLEATLAAVAQYDSSRDPSALREVEQWIMRSLDDAAVKRQVESGLAKLLVGEATFEAKRFACTQLAVIGSEASVPALTLLLSNPETVGIACLALAKNPSPQAGAALLQAADSLDGRALAQVAGTLGSRGDGAAVTKLMQWAGSSDLTVADAAIVALGRIANPQAMGAIAKLRGAADARLLNAVNEATSLAADHLVRTGQPGEAVRLYQVLIAPAQPDHVRRGALVALLGLDADGGEARILQTLAGADAILKPVAIAALPHVPRASASKAFADQLAKLPPHEQVLLIQVLAARKDPEARQAVQQQAGAGEKTVRMAAFQALQQTGDASTVAILARALARTQDPEELKAIELAMSSLSGGDAVDAALIAQVNNRMAGPKSPILAALVRRANPLAMPLFRAETASTDPLMAKLAFQGLSRTAQATDLPALLTALGGLRAAAAEEEAVAMVGRVLDRLPDTDERSAPVLAALKTTSDAQAAGRLYALLPLCGDAAALRAVVSALEEPSKHDLAMRLLADWPTAAAWDPLVRVYRQASVEGDRVVALRGLARLLGEQNPRPDAQLAGRYRELLASAKHDNDRKLLLGPLAGCAHPEALKLALAQLDFPGVQAEAKMAVRRIADAIKAQHPDAAKAALERIGAQ